jgi:hypothetical protein
MDIRNFFPCERRDRGVAVLEAAPVCFYRFFGVTCLVLCFSFLDIIFFKDLLRLDRQ